MELFKITFALCYYLGLYPFRYRKNEFKITKLGYTFMLANVVVFIVLYGIGFIYKLHREAMMARQWEELLVYWHFSQMFIVLYCLLSVGVKSNLKFSNYCLQICTPVDTDYKISGFVGWYFILNGILNLVSYLWFNTLVLRTFGTKTSFIATFSVLHIDIIFVAFETFILFLLNVIEETLRGVELRLKIIQSILFPAPMIQQRSVTRHQLFKMAHRLSAQQSLEIRKLRIIHYECTSLAEKLINKYKFLLLYVVGHTYVTMVSYWYVVVHTIYLYLLQKQPQDMVFMSSAAIYIVTKMISLWTLFDADNQLNQQIKNIRLVLHKLTLPFQFSDITKEIRIFKYQCFVKPVKLTVAGLFNLDTNFLQTSLAAALAYVVLMMQYTVDTKQPENRLSNTTSTEDPTFVTSSTPMSR